MKIIVPDLGDGIEKVEVVLWHAKPGDPVCQGDDLVELVTDKASFNVPSPAQGVLTAVHIPAGQEVPVGALLGEIV